MSIQALNWAFSQSVRSSSAKFILVTLANFANEDLESYPSIQTVSRLTGLNRKTVISSLDRLASLQMIKDTGKRKGFTSSVKVYLLSGPGIGTTQAVPKTDMKQSRFFPKQSQKRDTEPLVTSTEPKGERKGPRKFPKELHEQIKAISNEIQRLTDFGRTDEDKLERLKLIARRKELRQEYYYA